MMFSKGPQEMSALFDFLGPESVTVIDIYWKIILRYFHVTSAPRRFHHLEFLRQFIQGRSIKPEDKSEKRKLLARLKDIAILPGKDGGLKTAS